MFGEFVKYERVARKLSQDEVAKALDFTHRSNISRLESGKLEWKLREIQQLARLFKMKASRLLAKFERWEKKADGTTDKHILR